MIFGITKAKANTKLQRAFATRDFAGAIAAYRKVIAKTPRDHELFNNLGVAYLESGELAESIKAFHNANELFPACTHYNNLGRALLQRKEYTSARDAFAKARDLDAADPQPWYNITVSFREEGRQDEAHRELLDFLRTHPTHGNGLNDLGCYHLDRGETDEAMTCFTKAIDSDPAALSARLNLIRLLCDTKQYPSVMPHLEALAQQGIQVRVRAEKELVSIYLNDSLFCHMKLGT